MYNLKLINFWITFLTAVTKKKSSYRSVVVAFDKIRMLKECAKFLLGRGFCLFSGILSALTVTGCIYTYGLLFWVMISYVRPKVTNRLKN